MKNLIYVSFPLLLLLFQNILAQPAIQWQKSLGGSGKDEAHSIIQTTDGGYFMAGNSFSGDGDLSGNAGYSDLWVIKMSSVGDIQWKKSLGGSNIEYGRSARQTSDGGFIVLGSTNSTNGDVSGNHGSYDFWVVKFNSAGDIQWQKCLGGTGDDYGLSITLSSDGGYVLAGRSGSNNGDVSGNHGYDDFWIVKLNSTGIIQWQKSLGSTVADECNSIIQTTDGGYLAAGFTSANDGDVSGNHGDDDAWLAKLNSSGILEWQKCLGGTGGDGANSVSQTTDGGYIVTGLTKSIDGDVTGNHGLSDAWVVKLNNNGDLQWQKCLGGASLDLGYCVVQTSDGGFTVAGETASSAGDVSGNHGDRDYWVVNLNSAGIVQWQKCLGGTIRDYGRSLVQTSDGGYMLAGFSESNDGDVTGNHGGFDGWLVKLPNATVGLPSAFRSDMPKIHPNPALNIIQIQTNDAMMGKSYCFLNGQGTEVLPGKIHAAEMQLSIEQLPAGIYSFRLEGEGQAIRLVKGQ